MEAQGTEFALGYSLNYDATKFSNPVVKLGRDAPAASVLTVNTKERGQIGMTLDGLPFGQTFGVRIKQIVEVRFTIIAAPLWQSKITIGDVPVLLEVSDELGIILATSVEVSPVTFIKESALLNFVDISNNLAKNAPQLEL